MPVSPVKIVALTQEHHRHGVSTAIYFLAQALARQQVPVLLADLTSRNERLRLLDKNLRAPNAVLWSPPPQAMRDVPAMLARVREQVQDTASTVLLDIDRTTLDLLPLAEGNAGIDYLLIAASATPDAQKSTDQLAQRFTALHERERIGVAFARIGSEDGSELPPTTPGGLPMLGFWPADYRLATMEDENATAFGEPHQSYLDAINRLGMRLIRLVPLSRL